MIKQKLVMWEIAFGALAILNFGSMLVYDNAITDLQVLMSSVLCLICRIAIAFCK